jgi:hypothetical protein
VRINASNDYWKFYLGRRWDGGKLVCGIAEWTFWKMWFLLEYEVVEIRFCHKGRIENGVYCC